MDNRTKLIDAVMFNFIECHEEGMDREEVLEALIENRPSVRTIFPDKTGCEIFHLVMDIVDSISILEYRVKV